MFAPSFSRNVWLQLPPDVIPVHDDADIPPCLPIERVFDVAPRHLRSSKIQLSKSQAKFMLHFCADGEEWYHPIVLISG